MEIIKCNYDGEIISYKKEGTGAAVVFVHGFGEDSKIWRKQEGTFNNFCCIYIDLPGSGDSPFNQKLSSILDYAKAVNAVLENEKIDHCILIGHSMGGYIALAFAQLFADKLLALCLFHSSAFADSEEKIKNRKKSIEFVTANGAAKYFKTIIPDLFFDNEKSANLIQEQLAIAALTSDAAVVQYLQAMIDRQDTTSVLKILGVPVGFILGEYDKAVPFTPGLEQSHLADVTYLHVLRQSAHMGMLEETSIVREILGEFLISCSK